MYSVSLQFSQLQSLDSPNAITCTRKIAVRSGSTTKLRQTGSLDRAVRANRNRNDHKQSREQWRPSPRRDLIPEPLENAPFQQNSQQAADEDVVGPGVERIRQPLLAHVESEEEDQATNVNQQNSGDKQVRKPSQVLMKYR